MFERTVETGTRAPATTADYLAVVAATRPTLTVDMTRAFEDDIRDYGRV